MVGNMVLPVTVYAVAYSLAWGAGRGTACPMFVVPGRHPLAEQEIYARAYAMLARTWDIGRYGPLGDHPVEGQHWNYIIIGDAPPG